jgi:hypothetical protein
MQLLVERVLVPLLDTAPSSINALLTGSKKAAKKRAHNGGGLNEEDADHYQHMLAVVHLLNTLDVWRRNTQVFLT